MSSLECEWPFGCCCWAVPSGVDLDTRDADADAGDGGADGLLEVRVTALAETQRQHLAGVGLAPEQGCRVLFTQQTIHMMSASPKVQSRWTKWRWR